MTDRITTIIACLIAATVCGLLYWWHPSLGIASVVYTLITPRKVTHD